MESHRSASRIRGIRWRLVTADGTDLGSADAVVTSAPPLQSAGLLQDATPALAARIAATAMAPCHAVMVGFERPLDLGFDGGFVHDSPLSWVARNASKPGRHAAEAWVLHGSPEWSAAHLEAAPDVITDSLLAALRSAVGGRLDTRVAHARTHRWRFALPHEARPERCLVDRETRLIACGDWCGGPRIEGAWLSGRAAANAVLEALGSNPA